MKIKSIKISGFRSINQEIELKPSNICAILGANNAGKSNILNAINKVLGRDWVTVNVFDEEDVYNNEYDKDIQILIEFEKPLLYEQFVGVDPIPIPKIQFIYTRYKIGENKGQRRLEKNCLTTDNKQVNILVKKPQKGEQRQYKPLTTIPQEIQEKLPVIYIGAERQLKNQLPSARYSLLGLLMQDIDNDFNKSTNSVTIRRSNGSTEQIPRAEAFNSYIKKALEILKTDEFVRLERSIKENALLQLGFDPKLDADKLDIYFTPLTSLSFYKSLEIFIKENNFQINATELGQGFQNAIVIAIVKAFEENRKQGALFLIEEPELYLHPQMQRSLYKTIRKIGETNQVIYITHSPNFVTIPDFQEVALVRKSQNGTEVIHSTLKPDSRLIEKFRKELDPERNEMFFAKRVLFVEGDTEKLALPEYARRLNIDIDNKGISIIEVGGKRSIVDFVELAMSFQIEVAFIYDTDSSAFEGKKDEEKSYNELLDSYSAKGIKVFSFEKNYEDELRKFYGEDNYQKMCGKYERTSKPIRARLFALDTTYDIPKFILPITNWLNER